MNPSKKRKVIGKCQVPGCVVSEKRCPGIDAFHCKCQCGNTWYKSLCGKHEISSFNDMQRMLSKQQTKDNGTENKDAPTTRIEQNKKCSNCTSTNVVEPSTITVRSHCILQYKCECKHEWFTDQSGKTKRGRRDKLINKLNTDMSPSVAQSATNEDRKVHKCRKCKEPLPGGTLHEYNRVQCIQKQCTICSAYYYSCPSCDSCCTKERHRTVKHIRDNHEELSSETANRNDVNDATDPPLISSSISSSFDEDHEEDQDSRDNANGCEFDTDICLDYDDEEVNEEEALANENSDLATNEKKAIRELEQQQYEKVRQEQQVRDFISDESNWGRQCSSNYFSKMFAGQDGLMDLVDQATALKVDTETDRDYHLYVTQFVNHLTKKQRMDLVNIFNVSTQRLGQNEGAETPLTNFNEMESKYISGTNSILQNMPVPSVQEKDKSTGFVMISSKEIINHMLARGFPLKEYEWNNKSHWYNDKGEFHSDTLREIREKVESMTEVVPDDLVVHILYIWSDAFQKNSLITTKSTDIQLFTAYFVPPDDVRDIKKYTQPLAIGVKRKDHQQLLVSVLDEMLSIGKIEKRYCARRQKMIHVVIVRTAIQNDNPERKNNTQTLNTGIYHKWWKFSCQFTGAIPSCSNCFLNRLAKVVNHDLFYVHDEIPGICSKCGDWWLNFENEQTWMPKPDKYPEEKCKDSPPAPQDRDIEDNVSYLKPVELSFEFLKTAYDFALHNHRKGLWNKGEIEAYLRTCCFNLGLIDAMKKSVEIDKATHGETVEIRPPEIWDKYESVMLELSEFVDTPMHMLFLGIMKHLMHNLKRLFKSAAHTSTFKRFLAIINTALEACKSQSISWCRTLSLSSAEEFGTQGWQSDNFSALARLSLVYFGYLEDIVAQDAEDDEEYRNSLQSLKEMLVLWNCLLSELFTDEKCDPDKVDHYARLFLSACCAYGDQTERGGKKAIFFEGTTNYFSLLNLGSLVRRFGDLKKLWEGEREKYIKFVKKVLYTMPQNESFLTTAMKRLLQSHCLDQLMEDNMHTHDDTYERLSNVKVYKDVESLCEHHWYMGKPLCGVTLKGCCEIFICIKSGPGINLFQVKFHDEHGSSKYNLWYAPLCFDGMEEAPHYFSRATPTLVLPSKDMLKTHMSDSVIIHPMVTCEDEYKAINGHTVISRNWKVRNKDGSMCKVCPMAESFICRA